MRYLYRPKSPDTSRLIRDGIALGDFEVREDGSIDVAWHREFKDVDAAVGYALAGAFGAGAQFFAMLLLDLLGHIPD